MPVPDKITVAHEESDLLRREFIYDQALRRVSDLNKSSFSYRTLYATIIAAYVGALSLLTSLSAESVLLPSVDVFVLALHGITLVVFATTMIICFFDFIFQEVIEASIRAAARIERRTPGMGWGKIALISHEKGTLTSLRISINMSLFYFVPAAAMFAILALTAVVVVPVAPSIVNVDMSQRFCVSAQLIDKLEDPILSARVDQMLDKGLYCALPFIDLPDADGSEGKEAADNQSIRPSQYEFPEATKKIVGLGYIIALGFLGYFFLYSSWRICERALITYSDSRLSQLIRRGGRMRKVGIWLAWGYTFSIFGLFFASFFWKALPEHLLKYSMFFWRF